MPGRPSASFTEVPAFSLPRIRGIGKTREERPEEKDPEHQEIPSVFTQKKSEGRLAGKSRPSRFTPSRPVGMAYQESRCTFLPGGGKASSSSSRSPAVNLMDRLW